MFMGLSISNMAEGPEDEFVSLPDHKLRREI